MGYKNSLAMTLMLISSALLQGCNNKDKITQPANVAPVVESSDSSQLTALKHCLNNANELVSMDKKYKKNHDELHSLIAETKAYSSFSDKTSENISRIVTPLFEYQINYKCDDISHLLIEEFRIRAQKAASLGGGRL